MIWIIEANYIEDYTIWIKFNDHTKGNINFEPILKKDHRKMISDLLNLEIFKNFSLTLDTICWSNGADFAPEFLYEIMKKAKHVA